MGKIIRNESNTYPRPKNSCRGTHGYIYLNVSNSYENGKNDHDKVNIGILTDPSDPECKTIYANDNYFRYFSPKSLPERPDYADSISVGGHEVVSHVAKESGLESTLKEVFKESDVHLILDLSSYMLLQESAVFQHFPHWARSHKLFSRTIRSDSYVSKFLKTEISVPQINKFKTLWAKSVIGDGRVFLCYDSTNVNSQAEGVFIVQKGHAKDRTDLPQVNTDYVVRQKDGLPVTFNEFPGSVTDIAEAPEMFNFFKNIIGDTEVEITMVCDRGYISEDNLKELTDSKIHYLMLLRTTFGEYDTILEKHIQDVKLYSNYIEEYGTYGITRTGKLGENDVFFHIFHDSTLEQKHLEILHRDIKSMKSELLKAVERKTKYTALELGRFQKWFDLTIMEAEKIVVKQRGKAKNKKAEVDSYTILSFKPNDQKIAVEQHKCGFYILVGDQKLSAVEAKQAMSKRDCVEKTFEALKSSLGMEKYGVYTGNSIFGKSLIWFVASILHSLVHDAIRPLYEKDSKSYTVNAVLDLIEEIVVDRDLTTNDFKRRYQLTKKQKEILNKFNLSGDDIDISASELSKNLPVYDARV